MAIVQGNKKDNEDGPQHRLACQLDEVLVPDPADLVGLIVLVFG